MKGGIEFVFGMVLLIMVRNIVNVRNIVIDVFIFLLELMGSIYENIFRIERIIIGINMVNIINDGFCLIIRW